MTLPFVFSSLPSRCSQTPVTYRDTSAHSTWGRALTPAPTAARLSPRLRVSSSTSTSTVVSSPSYVSQSESSYVSLHSFLAPLRAILCNFCSLAVNLLIIEFIIESKLILLIKYVFCKITSTVIVFILK